MIEVTKEFTFDAAHRLIGYPGPCGGMHGHTYRLQVSMARTDGLVNRDGMVVDFSELKETVKHVILDQVDHKVLNDVFDFQPTAENMAMSFYISLKRYIPLDVKVTCIRLWETPTSFAEFRP